MKDRKAPIGQHLGELRKRLIVSAVALLLGSVASFVFHQEILDLLLEEARSSIPVEGNIIYTEVTEFLGVTMKVSLLGGLVLALPVIVYEVVMFVTPGLKPAERRYLFFLLPLSLLSFAAGGAFGYKILIPPALSFLLNFGGDIATPMIRIGNIVNLMITLLFWMGLVFEIPIVMFFLSKIGVVTPRFLARQRRYAIVVAFILGAIITPTFDPINQTLVAMPIIVMYEVGILLAKLARRGQPRPSGEAEGAPASPGDVP